MSKKEFSGEDAEDYLKSLTESGIRRLINDTVLCSGCAVACAEAGSVISIAMDIDRLSAIVTIVQNGTVFSSASLKAREIPIIVHALQEIRQSIQEIESNED